MNTPGHSNTAILIFAHSSVEEIRHKPIKNGDRLFDELTRVTLMTAKKTGIPYYHYSGDKQQGNLFADRFINAIKDVFDLGYDNVITIGNDSPQLTHADLCEAQEMLSQGNFVLGPSLDGGFYLMGLHKSQFDPNSFLALSWQSSKVSHELLDLISNKGISVVTLRPLSDIDTHADLHIINKRSYLISARLRKIIQLLLHKKYTIFDSLQIRITTPVVTTPLNKGSPLSIRFH